MNADEELVFLRRRLEADPQDEEASARLLRSLERIDGVRRDGVVVGDAVVKEELVVVAPSVHQDIAAEKRKEDLRTQAEIDDDIEWMSRVILLAKLSIWGIYGTCAYMFVSISVLLFSGEEGQEFWVPFFDFLGHLMVAGSIGLGLWMANFQIRRHLRNKEREA